MLVEAISGQGLDRFLQERILEPPGMVDTHYNVLESKVNRGSDADGLGLRFSMNPDPARALENLAPAQSDGAGPGEPSSGSTRPKS